MTTQEYLNALKTLDLNPASEQTAGLLGLSVRQCQRLSAGHSPIGEPLSRLIEQYLQHGLPNR